MEYALQNDLGKITIDESVFQTIAGVSVAECYGVLSMAARKTMDSIIELFKRENLSKGVKVSINGEEVIVDLHIVVGYGTSIVAVASSVMETVKYNLENQTGIAINAVNVVVAGVRV